MKRIILKIVGLPRILYIKIEKLIVLHTVKSCKGGLFVGGKTRLNSNTVLGYGCSFNGMTVNGGGQFVYRGLFSLWGGVYDYYAKPQLRR